MPCLTGNQCKSFFFLAQDIKLCGFHHRMLNFTICEESRCAVNHMPEGNFRCDGVLG